MAETATYTWSSFNVDDADNGVRVGFQQTEANDLSKTGVVAKNTNFKDTTHKVVIDGISLFLNPDGLVKHSYPSSSYVNQTVQMVTCEMKTSYGNQQAITRGVSSDSEEVATLSSMEPRDQFAIHAMQAIISRLDANPAEMDDANILFNCRAAYRWAQGMMIASADARAEKKKSTDDGGGDSGDDSGESSGTTRSVVDTSGGTDTEKLLGNLVTAIDDLTKQTKANNEAILKTTLKIDNATETTGEGDSATTTPKKLQVEGAGGGTTSILNRDDVNDSGEAVTDILIYNSVIGKAPVRITLPNFIKKAAASLSDDDKTTIYTALKPKMQEDFDANGAAAQALTDAKAYTDSKINNNE